jgi:SAM-dependent methyltransferase
MGALLSLEINMNRSSPVTWTQILEARLALVEVPEPENVQRYIELVRDSVTSPPYHLMPILRHLKEIEIETGKARAEITVLDHGCGGGATLMYLAAFGYRRIHGVDVGGDIEKTDKALRLITGLSEPHLFLYDGKNLPFSNEMFDCIFSQQVLEHVNDDCIKQYLDEEVRVLHKMGVVYHQIPHRWTPWESHTRTWGIHYLPLSIRSWMYRLLGHDPEYVEKILFLRSPLYFKRQLRARYTTVANETLRRLALRAEADYYSGNIKLRRLVSAGARLPVINVLLSNLVMLDVTTRKRCKPPLITKSFKKAG